MKILIGPAHELHDGVHGSLLAVPPPDTTYLQCPYRVRFRPDHHHASPSFSPLHDPAVEEWVRFDDVPSDVDVVHSSRLPVETALPWVVDADCLLLPLQAGLFFTLGAASRGAPLVPDPRAVVRREAAMAARYADGRCARILFRTHYARGVFLDHLAGRGHQPETIEKLSAKCDVVYPAVPALPMSTPVERSVSVLYMGRSSQDKGAQVAAEVFGRLRARHGARVRLVFVGHCPDGVADRLAAAGAERMPLLPRPAYLEQLRRADVFLSPTSFESFGMGLVEAAAAGLAIVCSSGPGMEHIGELFASGENALFVSNTGPVTQRVAGFTSAASALIDNESLRRSLSTNNYALTSHGRLSLQQRDERLRAVYAHAARLGVQAVGSHATAVKGIPRDGRRITDWSEDVCRWAGQHCTALIGGGRVIVRAGADA
ncbi:glycosyltransferase family 4 protein [Streptomyces sp. ID05-39B]|uniref:glycosyltransferase family 4 protein n=1 Tax=Streptomyces sp. ID05-39B TaxID=3028664 RepID=UPI0029B53FD9|nr:glycosyltransferase family 4 protein [Streptomyces sp. ID05-39B]MDX3527850.1 glycosyltransferase family 4 protein [Streptomyces sp. ID05-39B]